ncbi:MAG TPA: ATP-binding protein, partial [Acidobacteriota bacterium]|nr:ATP-binding protein [Acidobacteriota bacterium]
MKKTSKKSKKPRGYNLENYGDLTFESNASVIHNLGEGLIKDSQTAVSELTKNSYDADATRVEIEFKNLNKDNCKIIIKDNGEGMSKDEIDKKWMVLSTDNKKHDSISPKYGRIRIGEKGIGRFAVDKLGGRLTLVTKKENEPFSFKADFDWEQYSKGNNKSLDEVKNPYGYVGPEPNFHHGVKLIIRGLRDKWTKQKARNIIDELCQLIDPEEKNKNFEISFKSNDWSDLNGVLSNPLAGKETHRIDFEIDSIGNYVRTLSVGNKEPKIIKEGRSPLSSGPLKGNLRYYAKGITLAKVKLSRTEKGRRPETHRGVKIRRDKFRVRPYGEEGDDWLEIKKKRSIWGGKYAIRDKYLSGTIHISRNENPDLRDSTDRESLQENDAFFEMKEFVLEHIQLLNELLREEESQEQIRAKRENVKKVLDYCSIGLNKQESDEYKTTIEMLDKRKKGQHAVLKDKKEKTIKKSKPIRNALWQCNACGDTWKAPIEKTPTKCREFSVRTDGTLIDIEGCGSKDIKKFKKAKTHEDKENQKTTGRDEECVDIISGAYALVSGKMLTPKIDYDMKEEDEEEREIAVNPSHISYKISEILDKKEGEVFQIGEGILPPALSTHIIKCICLAWGDFHGRKTEK